MLSVVKNEKPHSLKMESLLKKIACLGKQFVKRSQGGNGIKKGTQSFLLL